MGVFRLKISRLNNGSFVASVLDHEIHSHNGSQVWATLEPESGYDDQGALYYVIVVVFMYGFSIILMIGSSMKKSQQDNGMNTYMKDLDKMRRLERRQEKFKMRLVMNKQRVNRILGPDRAEMSVLKHTQHSPHGYTTKSNNPSPNTSTSHAKSSDDETKPLLHTPLHRLNHKSGGKTGPRSASLFVNSSSNVVEMSFVHPGKLDIEDSKQTAALIVPCNKGNNTSLIHESANCEHIISRCLDREVTGSERFPLGTLIEETEPCTV